MAARNPYATTETDAGPEVVHSSLDVAPEVVAELRAARPWIFIIAVLAIGLGALTSIGGMIGSFFWVFGDMGQERGLVLGVMGGYAVIGVITLVPGVMLARTGISIGRVEPTDGTPALVETLRRHKRFWISIVLAAGASIALYVVVLVVAVASFASKGAGG